MDELKEKIKKLNLLPITPSLAAYICEFDPAWLMVELDIYEYAKFFNGNVYLYSQEYVENTTVDQFNIEFARAIH